MPTRKDAARHARQVYYSFDDIRVDRGLYPRPLQGMMKNDITTRVHIMTLSKLWQADIDAAFRRIPIKPEHRWASGIAFKVNGKVAAAICQYARSNYICISCAGDDEHAQRVYVRGHCKRTRLGKSRRCPVFHRATIPENRGLSLRR